MSNQAVVEKVVSEYRPNELIIPDELYRKLASYHITRGSMQKSLERMCRYGSLDRAAKGVYYKPIKSKYGPVPLSEQQIIEYYTANQNGMIVGYALYNSLGLTTQIAKYTDVYSARLTQRTKTLRKVRLKKYDLEYTPEVIQMIKALEVLQNYASIQDLNHYQFLDFCKKIPEYYSDSLFEMVTETIHYRKKQ